jgi:hypothetical protein
MNLRFFLKALEKGCTTCGKASSQPIVLLSARKRLECPNEQACCMQACKGHPKGYHSVWDEEKYHDKRNCMHLVLGVLHMDLDEVLEL